MSAKKCTNCPKGTLVPQTATEGSTDRKFYCNSCGASTRVAYDLVLSGDVLANTAHAALQLARVQALAPRVAGIEKHLEDGQKPSETEQAFYDAVKEFSAILHGEALETEVDKLFKLTEAL